MRKIYHWIMVLLCVMILGPALSVYAEDGSYLIKFQKEYAPDVEKYQLKEINKKRGIYEIEDIKSIKPLEERIECISPNSKIRLIEGEETTVSLMGEDLYSEQWQLQMICADAGWALETYGNDIRVAVIDSGCYEHEDLKNNLLEGKNYITGTTDVTDHIGHGTHVSGIIAAEMNDIGIVGVAPKAKIVPLKCFDSSHETDLGEIIEAIYDAVDVYDCKIINMSWGLKNNDPFLKEAIDYAYDKGVILVASVGNYSSTVMYYPAAYENVIGVSSVNIEKNKSYFAQYNQSVLVTAPGEKVKSTYLNNEYQVLQGTSQAAPMISGIAAVALSMDTNMTNQEFKNILTDTAEDLGVSGYDTKFGYGLVNEKVLTDRLQEKIPYYVSPINTKNGESYVLIKNNAETDLSAISIFSEYNNHKLIRYKQLPIRLLPDDERIVSIESDRNQLNHFLWKNGLNKFMPLTLKRGRSEI